VVFPLSLRGLKDLITPEERFFSPVRAPLHSVSFPLQRSNSEKLFFFSQYWLAVWLSIPG